jgi:hypothetical protein
MLVWKTKSKNKKLRNLNFLNYASNKIIYEYPIIHYDNIGALNFNIFLLINFTEMIQSQTNLGMVNFYYFY